MTIDNFDLFRSKLEFKTKADRYIVHILCRPKDIPLEQRVLGANEHQRLIRTYYIDSLEYFDKKVDAMKNLAIQNHARVYILPQVRDNIECLWNLSRQIQDAIYQQNYSVKPEHLLRGAYCECHKSRDKRWVLDLDDDCMEEPIVKLIPYHHTEFKRWTVDNVLTLVRKYLVQAKRNPDDAYVVKTRSGHHIITPPFDLQKAFLECSLMFEGEKKMLVGEKFTGPDESEPVYKHIVGWLHKDGMSLMYYNDGKN